MESKDVAAQQLRDLERAEAAPYVDYPPTPRWYPFSAGVWSTAVYAVLYAVLVHSWGGAWSIVTLVALIGVEAAFFGWYSRYHGALPALGRTPGTPEIRRAYGRFLIGFVAVLVVVCAAAVLGGPYVGGVATFLLTVTGLIRYERIYAQAARSVRQRLA